MRPYTERMPKALVPVAGVPFVRHQLALLAQQGFDDVVFCIGYRGEMLQDEVGDGTAWGVRVAYSDDGPDLRGTGGALRVALDAGLLDERFALVYGDSYLPLDVAAVRRGFASSGLPALMTVYRNDDPREPSNAVYADGLVLLYRKHDLVPEMHHVDYGLTFLERTVVAERVPGAGPCDLATVLEGLSAERRLAGFEVTDRYYEVGSPEGLAELERYLTEGGA
jgi:NDP-sugar pyrophosphorylase family protein